jgi:hypothetical protein
MIQEAGASAGTLLTNAGLSAPQPPPPHDREPSPARESRTWWALKKVWTAIGVLFFVLASFVPWFSIDPEYALKASDPFTESFKVIYDGWIPISKVEAYCGSSYSPGNNIVFKDNMTDGFEPTGKKDSLKDKDVAPWLFHGGQLSVTCDSFVAWMGGSAVPDRFRDGSKLDVIVVYKILGIPRAKSRSFKLVSDSSAQYHWQYVP